jgi:hypothetical protein
VGVAALRRGATSIERSDDERKRDGEGQPSERKASMKSKRQTTRAKLARERLVQDRRVLKREKKQFAATAARDIQIVEATASCETAETGSPMPASRARLFTEGTD